MKEAGGAAFQTERRPQRGPPTPQAAPPPYIDPTLSSPARYLHKPNDRPQPWRVAFRRRYFTRAHQLQRSLEGFLRFYNEERSHQGYQTQGRTPAEVFWGAMAHAPAKEA